MDEVVTGFLRNKGEVLLLRRSEEVGSYTGKWGAVSGYAEGDPDRQLLNEIAEETGIDPATCSLVRSGEPFAVDDEETNQRFLIHPYLFDCPARQVEINWESTEYVWTSPTEILQRETVPDLWQSYDQVRPTVETVETDSIHGSAYISLRALEVLRDEAGLIARQANATGNALRRLGTNLLDARPAMTVVRNRINRVMDRSVRPLADSESPATIDPATVEETAHRAIRNAIEMDQGAAETLQKRILDERVATLSRSGTVLQALRAGEPAAVLVSESRPGREGIDVAEQLSNTIDITVTSDAAFPHQLSEWGADMLVIGADTVFADGSVRNKVGTRPAAVTATDADIPVVVATATDKISYQHTTDLEPRPGSELYDGSANLDTVNPTFDITPPDAVSSICTEAGVLDPDELEPSVETHRRHASWQERLVGDNGDAG